jgi:hypothetical protein
MNSPLRDPSVFSPAHQTIPKVFMQGERGVMVEVRSLGTHSLGTPLTS